MAEKQSFFSDNLDYIRRALMHEPRGHDGMFGAVLLPSLDPGADLAALFMDQTGCLTMCGHASIAIGVLAAELGLVPEFRTREVSLETTAGLVSLRPHVRDGVPTKVSFRNVPSFFLGDHALYVPGVGVVRTGLSFGGSFFALVSTEELGFRLEERPLEETIGAALRILGAAQRELHPEHPATGHLRGVRLVELFEPLDSGGRNWRTLNVWGRGQFDRSPCGSGTSALIARLYSRGELTVGDSITSHGLAGVPFQGFIAEETQVAAYPAVIPDIHGSASIVGLNQWIIDPRDDLAYGFKPSADGFAGIGSSGPMQGNRP
jgi:proline racemase